MAWQDELEGPDRNAASALISLFESYGLGTLAPKIVDYVQQGYGEGTIPLLLQDTQEYKQRFAANDARRAAGLPVLAPGEYIETERAYAQALRSSGMPPGFYDDPASDFRRFLERDVAPTEIAERSNEARQLVDTLDPLQRRTLAQRRGLGDGDLAAFYLDTEKALPALQRQVQTALLGAERERAGFSFDEQRAEMLFASGVSADEAREGYGAIAQMAPTYTTLGEISDVDYGVSDLEDEIFGSSGEAAQQRSRLASQERARFSGASGTSPQSLRRRDRSSF